MTMAQKPATDKHMTAKPTVAEHMKTVKAAWDKAPAGAKKDNALKHYQAAEKAHTAKHDADATKELDAATHALA
jgi:hypothetical protein